MAFPISHYGEIRLTRSASRGSILQQQLQEGLENTFLSRTAEQLKMERGTDIKIEHNKVLFKGGFFRPGFKTNVLVPITDGRVEIFRKEEDLVIAYYLNFRQMLVIVTLLVVGGLGLFVFPQSGISITGMIALIVVSWLWLFGMNYLITVFRFPALLRQILKSLEAGGR